MPSPHCPPDATPAAPGRRALLASALGWPLAALAGCAAPWPEVPAGPGSSSALARLQESAAAHGLAAWRQVRDLSLGLRRGPAGRPASAAETADSLQLRWLPAQGLLAWQDEALPPRQQGWRQWGAAVRPATDRPADRPTIRLRQAGQWVDDPALLRAAAAQADLLRLLLLGPVGLVDTRQPVNWAEPMTLEGRRCDQLTLDLPPEPDDAHIGRLAIFIDRDQGLMRRLRLMSIAEQGQPGAMAATWDLPEPIALLGQQWPRLCQRVAPTRLAGETARWQLLGLDRNRGLRAADLAAQPWAAPAAAPAAALVG